MGKEFIRQATPEDIDSLIDIYIECFPERVVEVFGGHHRRVFIRDYLLFYLAWDPVSNWVYVKDGAIMGFIMVPRCLPPRKAMLSHAPIFRWIGHFLMGYYGFPIHLLKKFFSGGFAFTLAPTIKRLQGKPYILLIAVKPAARLRSSGVSPGIQLVRWMFAEHGKRGIHFWWAVVQPTERRMIPFWQGMGFRFSAIANGQYLAMSGEPEDSIPAPPCRGHRSWSRGRRSAR